MREISLDELKEILVEILEQVAGYCDRQGITYFLAYGTLLGAIRHKGYIPWDDDLDIAMPRPDYERFIREFNGSCPGLRVLSHSLDRNYKQSIAKVEKIGTFMDEIGQVEYCMGINIDIFPIDGLPDDDREAKRFIERIYRYNYMRQLKVVKPTRDRPFHALSVILVQAALSPFSFDFLLKKIDSLARTLPFGSTEHAGSCVLFIRKNLRVPLSVFSSSVDVEFEGRKFHAPVGYDVWLRSIFKDYMQLPPVEKRVSHHAFRAYV